MNNVHIFSHDLVTHYISAIHCSSTYSKMALWHDTGIRHIVKTIAQNVRWADTDIRHIVKTIAS